MNASGAERHLARRLVLWVLATVAVVVLLFSYRTSTMGAGGVASSAAQPRPTASSGLVPGPAGSGSRSSSAPEATTQSATYTGDVVATRWGPVQVRVSMANGRIADVQAVQYPNGNHRDEEINSSALPALHDAVLAAQSAKVDTVSGATVTSEGYISSLQSALDQAHR